MGAKNGGTGFPTRRDGRDSRSHSGLQRRHRRGSAVARGLAVLLTLGAATACRKTTTRFDILCFRNPEAPERLTEPFDPGSFALNAHNNWDIVFETSATMPVAERAGEAARAATQATAIDPGANGAGERTTPSSKRQPLEHAALDRVRVSQFIHVNVFWRPRPGKTYVESTQTNATLVYCLVTDGDVITYQGAGFVYFKLSRDGRTIKGEIESSNLVPSRRVNEPADLFGPCRLHGTFIAHRDRKHVVSVLQQIRRKLGP